jgi:hypothetical protein
VSEKPRGTNAEVKAYWREAWPNAMRRAGPRRAMASEIFPHLPAARTETSRRLEGRREAPGAPASNAKPLAGASFIDPVQAARQSVSPLGGVSRTSTPHGSNR